MLTTLLLASTLLAAPQNATPPAQSAPPAAKPAGEVEKVVIVERIVEAGPWAQSLANSLDRLYAGRIRAAAVGHKVVVTGDQDQVERVLPVLERLQAEALEEYKRSEYEQRRKAELESTNPWKRRFNVTLGPTLGASMESARKALDQDVNIVFASPELAETPVPTAELTNVDIGLFSEALDMLLLQSAHPDVRVRFVPTRNPQSPADSLPVLLVSGTASASARQAAQRQTPELAVFRTEPYPRWMQEEKQYSYRQIGNRQDDQLAAIDAGLELIGRSKDFKMKLHRETGMVFVYGTPQELQLVAQVLGAAPPGVTGQPPVLKDVPIAKFEFQPDAAGAQAQPQQPAPPAQPTPARVGRPSRAPAPAPAPAAPPAEPAPAPSPGGAPQGE
ncbi:MAG: hypothetical protein U0625_01725 [Phycisphaerales bacterium]